jgi:hypothetical protein
VYLAEEVLPTNPLIDQSRKYVIEDPLQAHQSLMEAEMLLPIDLQEKWPEIQSTRSAALPLSVTLQHPLDASTLQT